MFASACAELKVPGVRLLTRYATLGEYDFVSILTAPDNESVARASIELGVRAGAHVTTLPAIPISRFRGPQERRPRAQDEAEAMPPAGDAPEVDV